MAVSQWEELLAAVADLAAQTGGAISNVVSLRQIQTGWRGLLFGISNEASQEPTAILADQESHVDPPPTQDALDTPRDDSSNTGPGHVSPEPAENVEKAPAALSSSSQEDSTNPSLPAVNGELAASTSNDVATSAPVIASECHVAPVPPAQATNAAQPTSEVQGSGTNTNDNGPPNLIQPARQNSTRGRGGKSRGSNRKKSAQNARAETTPTAQPTQLKRANTTIHRPRQQDSELRSSKRISSDTINRTVFRHLQ